MKIFLLAALLLNSFFALSQSNVEIERENFFRLGARAGANLNKISGKSYNEGFDFNYQVGGFMQFNFHKKLGIQPEVSFVQSTATFSGESTDIYDDIFRDGDQKKAKLNYLEIPVFLNYNLGPSRRVKLQLGPAYGGLVKQTVDSLRTNRNIFKKNEWSVIGGLWIQLPFINLSARYKMGLTNINAIDDRQTWKNQAIQLGIGIIF
jgi:hypothetical protein